jgi:glucosamine 6-phosphate synthetase-like amidotransferase/phosphosugar isomerase protein
MCGIAGVYLRDPHAKADLDGMLTTMLEEIEHRGGDATGFVALGDEGVTEWQKAACDSKDFNRYRRSIPEGSRSFLAHTRWATQGLPAFVENNHPLRRGSFFVVHNGHISNDDQLFELAGRERFGQVDSEAIPARLASFGKLAAAPKLMAELHGAAAIAAVDEKNPHELVLARGSSSPLFVLQTKKYVLFGSTWKTVSEAYTKHIGRLPKKAKITNVPEGTVLHFVDGKVTKMTFKTWQPPLPKHKTIPWKATSTEVATYSFPSSFFAKKKDDEMLDCDACGIALPWHEIEYRYDPEELTTYQFCPECDALWEYDGDGRSKVSARIHDVIDAEWEAINLANLAEGEGDDE